jgi:hypothetical protein
MHRVGPACVLLLVEGGEHPLCSMGVDLEGARQQSVRHRLALGEHPRGEVVCARLFCHCECDRAVFVFGFVFVFVSVFASASSPYWSGLRCGRREASTTRGQVLASPHLCLTRARFRTRTRTRTTTPSTRARLSLDKKQDAMSAGEDDDVELQRASASLVADFVHLLPHLLRKRRHGLVPVKLMHKACSLVRPACNEGRMC